MVIRSAVGDDLAPLVRLLDRCVAAMQRAGIDQWDEVYPTGETLRTDIERGAIYVASLEAAPVIGAVVLDDRQAPEYRGVQWTTSGERVGVVHRLMVDPASQRTGIARELMGFIEKRARQLGYLALRLDTFSRNPGALRLYETLGYRDAGPVTLRKGPFRCFEKPLEVASSG